MFQAEPRKLVKVPSHLFSYQFCSILPSNKVLNCTGVCASCHSIKAFLNSSLEQLMPENGCVFLKEGSGQYFKLTVVTM